MIGVHESACPHCGGTIKPAAKICKHCRAAVERPVDHVGSSQIGAAELLKQAQELHFAKDFAAALTAYQRIVTEWPETREAAAAVKQLENLSPGVKPGSRPAVRHEPRAASTQPQLPVAQPELLERRGRRRFSPKVAALALFALAAIIVALVVARLHRQENAGLWTGTCPAPGSELLQEMQRCDDENGQKRIGVLCGRTVVHARTGNNDNYKVGDRLGECFSCGEFVKLGVYSKGVESCVETSWLKSQEFKDLAKVFGR